MEPLEHISVLNIMSLITNIIICTEKLPDCVLIKNLSNNALTMKRKNNCTSNMKGFIRKN